MNSQLGIGYVVKFRGKLTRQAGSWKSWQLLTELGWPKPETDQLPDSKGGRRIS
jgi:hypothetical protein